MKKDNINFIYAQSRAPIKDEPFGRYKVSYNGCGPVAVYNALAAVGKDISFETVIAGCEKFIHLGGIFGMTAGNMKKTLKYFGCDHKCVFGRKKIDRLICEGTVFLMLMNNSFWIFGGRHWVMFTKSEDGRIYAYNAARKSAADEYPDFDAFYKSYIKSGNGEIVCLFLIK